MASSWKQTFQTNLMNSSFLGHRFSWRRQKCLDTRTPLHHSLPGSQAHLWPGVPSRRDRLEGQWNGKSNMNPIVLTIFLYEPDSLLKIGKISILKVLETLGNVLKKCTCTSHLAWGPLIQGRARSRRGSSNSVRLKYPWTKFGTPAFDLAWLEWLGAPGPTGVAHLWLS